MVNRSKAPCLLQSLKECPPWHCWIPAFVVLCSRNTIQLTGSDGFYDCSMVSLVGKILSSSPTSSRLDFHYLVLASILAHLMGQYPRQRSHLNSQVNNVPHYSLENLNLWIHSVLHERRTTTCLNHVSAIFIIGGYGSSEQKFSFRVYNCNEFYNRSNCWNMMR